MGIFATITVILAVLKLAGLLAISWLLVLLPLFIPAVLWFLIFMIALLAAMISDILG